MFYIYRLTDGEQDYYGQTENIERRVAEHRAPTCKSRSRLLDNSKMKLHIIHRLYTQQEADETEEFYQLNFPCVNRNIRGRTKKEYYEDNKDEILEKQKERYKLNRTKILTQVAEYRKNNLISIREKDVIRGKIYRENNKEKRNAKYTCECGGRYTHANKSIHFKSKKHQDYINSVE